MAPSPIDAETDCLYDDHMGHTGHFTDVCIDGYECDVRSTSSVMLDPDGDDKCHALCYPTDGPDGGAPPLPIPDGGVVASCNGTCKRVFGSDFNVGLCFPSASGDAGVDAGR